MGALIAVYGENRYISYAGFLLVLFTWMLVHFVRDDKVRKRALFIEGIFILICMIGFYGICMLPYFRLYGETSHLVATQSNYYNPVSEYYLADNLIYTLVNDKEIVLSENAVWCKKYFEAINSKVRIEAFQPKNKLKQSLDDFIHVGGMTLAANDDLFEKDIATILRNKSNLEQYTNYPQLYIETIGLEKATQIYIFSDKDYNLYFMPYEVYLNVK